MADDSVATSLAAEDGENTLGFGGERKRTRDNRTAENLTEQSASISRQSEPATPARTRPFDAGDLPEGMEARYLIERRRLTGEQRYFENATDTRPAFRDRGNRLVAENESRALIRDMVDIAQHRGWDCIRVSGSEEFRRAAWREAVLRGIEVDGYRPKPRELQEIARALADRDAQTATPATRARRPGSERAARSDAMGGQGRALAPARADFSAGVTGQLVDTGEARYGGKADGRKTSYADIALDDGRRERAWGIGLPAALRESGVAIGDRVTLRRLGTERVQVAVAVLDTETGERQSEVREVNRNRWSVDRADHLEVARPRSVGRDAAIDRRVVDEPLKPDERAAEKALADRFRTAPSAETARDPRLRAAQSQLVAAKAIVTATLGHDPAAAQRLIDRSRETIAQNIEQGRTIPQAELRGSRAVRQDRDRKALERAKSDHGHDEGPTLTKAPSRNRQR